MRKLKKLAVWAVVLAMVISMLPGMTLITAKAEPATPTLSETYPEATDLMTNGGYMNNSEKAWTDLITVEEMNSLMYTLLYESVSQFDAWKDDDKLYNAGETVNGDSLIRKALYYLGWNDRMNDGRLQAEWTVYFHLTRGIENYDGSAALTREQAAQILLNVLRSNTTYNPNGIKANDTLVALDYVKVSTDGLGRPSYQWQRNGAAVTAVYAHEPIAVIDGTSTWQQMMAATGLTETVSNAIMNTGYWSQRVYGYKFISEGVDGMSGMVYYGIGYDTNALQVKGWVMEIYDTFSTPVMYTDGTNDWRPRTYDILFYCDYLSYVNENHQIQAYIVPGGYGPWGGQPGTEEAVPGYYTMGWSNKTTTIQNLAKAETISGVLTNFDDNTVTVGDTVLQKSVGFNTVGVDLLVPENINKTYTFYLNSFGYLLGIKECSHDAWYEWEHTEGNAHIRYCKSCTLKQTGSCTAGAWEANGADGHVKKCTTCKSVMESAAHTLGSWTYVDENNCKKTCSDNCGYELVLPHDTEVRGFEPSSQIKPGYTGDTYCKNCGTKLATGQEIPKVSHEHIPGEPQKENEVAPDCENPGSYDEVIYCTFENCGEKLSSTHKTVDPLQHLPGTPVKENETPADCESKGGYDEVVYCTRTNCGKELSSTHKETDPTGHKWKETGRVPATATSTGSISYVCENNAEHTKTEVIPAELEGNTSYLEAVELALAMGILDTTKTSWTEAITGAEANQILAALYAAPGFVDPWTPDFPADSTVTGNDFMADVLVPIGWNYPDTMGWIRYNHLAKGLKDDFSATAALTREQACQILLNAMKAIPTYNPATIKANDPGFGLSLVLTGTDAMGRPSYKWQKGDSAVTNIHADTPVAILKGGTLWNDILTAVGYITDPGVVPAVFRWTLNGGELTQPVNKVHLAEGSEAFLSDEYVLEIYTDYSTDRTGYEYIIVCTSGDNAPEIPGGDIPSGPITSIPEVPADVEYTEAVQLLIAIGWLDADADMKGNLTGAEANKILQALYDGPGFVAEWHPDFAANATVTGKELTSDILVTTGWNYNNDALFTRYNHLEKGLSEDYSSSKALTREQAAQIVLNALKSVPTYNTKSFKYLDGGIGLTHVLVKRDEMGRPYYKWQKGGVDISDVYRDTPVTAMKGGIVWSDILNAVGDVGDINIAQMFRAIEEGGDPSQFVSRKHPDYDLFMDEDYALEVYLDYTQAGSFDTYAYTVVVYEGDISIPDTADNAIPMLMSLLCAGSAAALAVLVSQKKKKYI